MAVKERLNAGKSAENVNESGAKRRLRSKNASAKADLLRIKLDYAITFATFVTIFEAFAVAFQTFAKAFVDLSYCFLTKLNPKA